jgi:anti-sigma regulatory factor (Ser/Thr protein kinase)
MIRRHILDVCLSAGLDDYRCAQLSVSANEITTNALEHGGGSAEVVITSSAAQVSVEIHDDGPGISRTTTSDPPDPTASHGRGLWLADQLCDEMHISSGVGGTTVRLTMNR